MNLWKQRECLRLKERLAPWKEKLFVGQQPAVDAAIRRIREQIRKQKLSHNKVSTDAGLDASYLNKILNGKRHPTKYVWFRICVAAGCDAELMQQLMKSVGFAFDENNLVDLLLLYGAERGWRLEDMEELFCAFEDFGITSEICREVFGD